MSFSSALALTTHMYDVFVEALTINVQSVAKSCCKIKVIWRQGPRFLRFPHFKLITPLLPGVAPPPAAVARLVRDRKTHKPVAASILNHDSCLCMCSDFLKSETTRYIVPPLTTKVVRATTCKVWSKFPTGTDTSTPFVFCKLKRESQGQYQC